MKLIHKNFLYTAIITSILAILVFGYFIFMLPSLYVDYMSNKNYEAIVHQQKGYLKDGSYKNVTIENPTCITIDIPFSNDMLIVTGKTFQTKIRPDTDDMKKLIMDIKDYIESKVSTIKDADQSIDEKEVTDDLKVKALEWKDAFMKQATFSTNLPFTFDTQADNSLYENYNGEFTKAHFLSDDTIIIEFGVDDDKNYYTNYIGLTFDSDRVVISYLPTMTPQINEITPIVINSLPMFVAVIILFALVVSSLYSKGIVEPIIRLVKHTEAEKESGL